MKLAVLFLCCVVLSGCNMTLQGDNGLTVAGNSTSNVVTLALDGSVVRGVLADSGNATGEENWLSMLGAGNVTISASGSTITIACEGVASATYALDSDKLDGEHGSYYLSTTGTAADSTKFYGFTALQWSNSIDNQVVSGIEAVDIATDNGIANVDASALSIVGAGSVIVSGVGNVVTVSGNTTVANSDKLDGLHGSAYDSGVVTSSGNATVVNSSFSILGAGDVTTSASGSTVTVTGLLTNKVVYYTRVLSAVAGNVSYTGIGFQPRGLHIYAAVNGAGIAASEASWSISDSSLATVGLAFSGGTYYYTVNPFMSVGSSPTARQTAQLISYDADGFTLSWAKVGAPTATAYLIVYAMR